MEDSQTLSPEAQKRKEIVDAKYGAGTYEKAIKKINPHRCAFHLNEVFHGIRHRNFDLLDADFATIGTFFTCMFSEKGQEPPRKYPEAKSFLDHVQK